MKKLALFLLLSFGLCHIHAQESMKMISYYPTAFAQYKNIQTNTVDIKPAGGGQLSAENIVVDTLDVDGAINATETSLLETKKVEVGNTLDAGGTLNITGELRLNKSLDKVVSVKTQNAYLVDAPTLGGVTLPYGKVIAPTLTKMEWRPIKYKYGSTETTKNFLVLGIDPIQGLTCKLTKKAVSCGSTAAS